MLIRPSLALNVLWQQTSHFSSANPFVKNDNFGYYFQPIVALETLLHLSTVPFLLHTHVLFFFDALAALLLAVQF